MPSEPDAQLSNGKSHPNPLRSNPSFGIAGTGGRAVSHRHQDSATTRLGAAESSPGSLSAGSKHSEASSLEDDDSDDSSDNSDNDRDLKMAERPPYHRPTDGRSGTPLLVSQAPDERGRTRSKYGGHTHPTRLSPKSSPPPSYSRTRPQPSRAHSFTARQTLRSVSPASIAAAGTSSVRKKWMIAGFFLTLTLVSFCVQTELAKVVQTDLGWDKAYCMLYLTHGSWSLLFPSQFLILRVMKRSTPWDIFWRGHYRDILSTAWEVQHQKLSHARRAIAPGSAEANAAIRYIIRTTAIVTSALTVAGLSWYIAVNMTSPSDLTAIYNCSAFFAYVFSVPLLKEPLRMDKSIAVLIAIVGVLVVAYGDSKEVTTDADGEGGGSPGGGSRLLGNMVIGIGSVLYGLYEVLYKRLACPPEGASAFRSVIFANTFGACIGAFTLSVLWIPLPILHWIGWETFELPTGRTAWLLFLSVIMNATFAGSFLVLISLTSPVLSSVAALLTIFIVALSDWALTGEPLSAAAITGGLLIVFAFLMLSWSTWREMSEHAKLRQAEEEEGIGSSDSDSDSGSSSDRDEVEESQRMLG